MDSSSDSEEFYECDDDLDDDTEDRITVETKRQLKPKEEITSVPLVTKPNNNVRQTPSDCFVEQNNPLTKKSIEDNKKQGDLTLKSNNNTEAENLDDYPLASCFPHLMQQNVGDVEDSKSSTVEPIIKPKEEDVDAKETVENNNASEGTHLVKEEVAVDDNNLKRNNEKIINTDEGQTKLAKTVEEKCSIKKSETISKKTLVVGKLEEKTQDSDNMWDDNDWGDIDQNPSEEQTNSKVHDNNTALGVKKPSPPPVKSLNIEDKKPETKVPTKIAKPEENLWDDEDDWGKLEPDTKAEPDQPEENLWGDGDGWGDTPQESLKKNPSIKQENLVKTTPKVPEVVSNKESDLWTEGDNWKIEDPSVDDADPTKHASKSSDAKSALDALTSKEESSWSGWSNWGISSVLSTAATITTSVSQGFTTVLESGIGVPDPAELARIHKAEEDARRDAGEDMHSEEELIDENFVPFGLGNFVPGVSKITKLVETTGTRVITTGLGTLETIGKKTYEVLQENDPQLKKKRALLKLLEAEKPVLSTMLREAKERAESENKDRESRHFAKKANYETMFDDYTGLVHLEALEMLSKQCDFKLESILSQSRDVTEIQETMDQIKDLCELNTDDDDEDEHDEEELKSKMTSAVEEINIGISCEKVLESYAEVTDWIEKNCSNNPEELHSHAIENLAKITALAVEQYHKAGELLLVKEHRSTADEADSLVQLTTAISALISALSTRYTEKLKELTSHSTNHEIKTLISNIYLEAANSSRYIEDAFALLIPVIQVGAV